MEARIEHVGQRIPLPKVRLQTLLMLVVLVLNGLAGVIVHISSLLVAGIAAQGDASEHFRRPKNWEMAAGFALLLAVIGIVWRIPRLESHVLPAVKQAGASLARVIRCPR